MTQPTAETNEFSTSSPPTVAWEATVFAGVPTMYGALLAHPGRAGRSLASLRLCVYAMAPMSQPLLRRLIDEAIEGAWLACFARVPAMFIGPPGIGKSQICDGVLDRLPGLRTFRTTFNEFMTVDEVLGPDDDIAILVLRPGMAFAAGVPLPTDVRMTLQAVPEDVMHAVGRLQAFGREQGIDEKTLFGLAVALEEFASNIVNHAYAGRPHEQFQVEFACSADALTIELRDHGPAFDPTTAEARRADAGEELRGEGGWGILMARHYLDQMTYAREGDENVLRLAKRISPPPGGGSSHSHGVPTHAARNTDQA